MRNFKLLYLALAILLYSHSSAFASNFYGFWQTIDHKTHMPTSLIAIYPYQGKIYGKILANYDAQGNLDETLYKPRSRAGGLQGRPYYCGLDILSISPSSGRDPAKGHVIDPRNGKVYTAKVWLDKGNLVLRGELLIFGKNEVLIPYSQQHFNTGFQLPDLYQLTPISFH